MSPIERTSRSVARLYRFPVKGMTGERLRAAELATGQPLPHDRRFALIHGASRVDPLNPRWAPKTQFLMLARNPRLAALSVSFDAAAGTLALRRGGTVLAECAVADRASRDAFGSALLDHMGEDAKGAVHLVEAAAWAFTDVPEPWLSIVNLSSLRHLESAAGAVLDPLRFRANLYYEGGAPWEERDWPGREIRIGSVRLRVEEPIERCAATNVDPRSAQPDLNLPLVLERHLGHVELGVYASVVDGGTIREGDGLTPS